MDAIYKLGSATAYEVLDNIPDPPSYSAIRALLSILERKGHLKHTKSGARFVYLPVEPRHRAAQSAIKRLLNTFFGGSTEKAVAALLDDADTKLSEKELDRLGKMIKEAKKAK